MLEKKCANPNCRFGGIAKQRPNEKSSRFKNRKFCCKRCSVSAFRTGVKVEETHQIYFHPIIDQFITGKICPVV